MFIYFFTYFIFLNKFLLGYIHYTAGIQSDNSDLTYIVISYIAPTVSPPQPPQPLPAPLKVIARDFLVLFHICVWSPSTIMYCHLNLLPSSSPLPLVPPHYLPSCFSLWTFKLTFKEMSRCMSTGVLLCCLGWSQPPGPKSQEIGTYMCTPPLPD
jgi:hypothetical protein